MDKNVEAAADKVLAVMARVKRTDTRDLLIVHKCGDAPSVFAACKYLCELGLLRRDTVRAVWEVA